ncbi:MAG: GTP cyclohydrolase I, partial [Leuconostoc citreum]|nr:GTP cyclohydrolase I [Leuconostoc citreum]
MKTFNQEQTETLVQGVKYLLTAVGDDPERTGLLETPERVIKAHAEIYAHTGETTFKDYKLFDTTDDADMVIVEDIPFYAMCEHHLL